MKTPTSGLDSGVVTHPRRSMRYPAKVLNDLDVADDIDCPVRILYLPGTGRLTSTAAAAKDLGLIISVPKTEYMTVNCLPQPSLQVYGEPINHVTDFRYLGSKMASAASD